MDKLPPALLVLSATSNKFYLPIFDVSIDPTNHVNGQNFCPSMLTDCIISRAASKGGLREFLSVMLSITQGELEDGLQGSRNCPPVLLEWLKKDAVSSHAAIE